jgi:malate/lactate dehydrogenase
LTRNKRRLPLSTVFSTRDLTLGAAAKGGNLQAFEVLLEGHEQRMGRGEVFFFLRAIVNRDGVARVPLIPIDRSEQEALEASAEAVKQQVAALDG